MNDQSYYSEKQINRSYLYRFAAESIAHSSLNNRENLMFLRYVFYDSVSILRGMEDQIKDASIDLFYSLFDENIKELRIEEFKSRLRTIRDNGMAKVEKEKKSLSFNSLFLSLLSVIIEYQNSIIGKRIAPGDIPLLNQLSEKPKTFLSYAFDDKGLSLALFLYFEFHGGFLFVDWMWNGKERNGKLLKEKLENELKESSQLLFLRTTASELNLRGNHIIRQWCSWEIGNFYSKKKEQKYLLAFYNQNNRNILLDSFHVFHDVSNGVII